MAVKDQAEELREMIKERTQIRSEQSKESRAGRQRILAVASGKGGVGKTNLCVNLSIDLANKGRKVLLMDADLGLSNVNVVMGVLPEFNLYHVLKGEKQLADIVFETKFGVDIIAGANGFSELADLTSEERFKFIEQLDFLEKYDEVILDTGAGISKNVTTFLHAADKVIIITTPEPTSMTDAYGIIKTLITEDRHINLQLVINRCESANEGRKISDRIIHITKQYLEEEITSLGIIYHDKIVSQAVFKKKPFIVLDPDAKSSISISSIGSKLLGLPGHGEKSGIKQFVKKLFHRL